MIGRLLRGMATKASRPPESLHAYVNSGRDPSTNVYRGTLFELQTQEALRRLGMRLQRVGGRGDRGVDLYGDWPLASMTAIDPKTQQPVALPDKTPVIIAQCKNLKMGCTPNHLRALMGTVVNDGSPDTIGLMVTVSHRHFTRDVLSHFTGSNIPLGLVRVEETQVTSLMFNESAQRILQELSLTTQFDPHTQTSEPVLMWAGCLVRPNFTS